MFGTSSPGVLQVTVTVEFSQQPEYNSQSQVHHWCQSSSSQTCLEGSQHFYCCLFIVLFCTILNFYFPQYKISSFGLQENEVFFSTEPEPTGLNASVLVLLGNIKTISYIY